MKIKRALALAVVGIFLGGFTWQSIEEQKESYKAVGESLDVVGYEAHYYTQGQGELVFCFITGSGTPCSYTDFYKLQNELAKRGQTITFDHAGSGWSTTAHTPRTIENLVNELSILIDTVAPNKKVILLCHSLGSLEAIGYAQMNPNKLKGIVFLDSGSPEFYSKDSELVAKIMNRSIAFIRALGINRLLGEMDILLPFYGENIRNPGLSEAVKNLDKAMYNQLAGNPATLSTIELINENATKVLEGPHLGEIPVLCLASDSGSKWDRTQRQLASWSKNSTLIKLKGSKHYLYWSNYDEVINDISEFIEDIQE